MRMNADNKTLFYSLHQCNKNNIIICYEKKNGIREKTEYEKKNGIYEKPFDVVYELSNRQNLVRE